MDEHRGGGEQDRDRVDRGPAAADEHRPADPGDGQQRRDQPRGARRRASRRRRARRRPARARRAGAASAARPCARPRNRLLRPHWSPSVTGSASITARCDRAGAGARGERARPAGDGDHATAGRSGPRRARPAPRRDRAARPCSRSARRRRSRMTSRAASSARCAGRPAHASSATAASSMSCGGRPSRASIRRRASTRVQRRAGHVSTASSTAARAGVTAIVCSRSR